MDLALETLCVLDGAGHHCKQRIVLAATNVLAGMEVRATLTNENFSGINGLTGKTLAAEPLCV